MINVKDFGAAGDGVADDSAEFQAALDCGVKAIYVPIGTYKIGTVLTPPSDVVITLEDAAVLKPTMSTQLLRKAAASNITTKTVTGANIGATSISATSKADLAVGQHVKFSTNAVGGAPPSWNKIKSITGADPGPYTVGLEEPLPISYTGTVTMTVPSLHGDFLMTGGMIDLTSVPSVETPGLIAVEGYKSARVEGVTFRGPYTSTTVIGLVTLRANRRAAVDNCHAEDVICFASAFEVSGSKHARVTNSTIDGDCFGVYMGGNDYDEIRGIVYTGRWKSTDGVHGFSVRATKVESGRHSVIADIIAHDCETVVEWVDSGRGRISNIVGVNLGLRADAGQTAINIARSAGVVGELNTIAIDGVLLENIGGYGIQVSGDNAGRIVMSNLNIKACQRSAILLNTLHVAIGPAVLEDWNKLENANYAGIESNLTATGGGLVFHDIIFVNSVATLKCFSLEQGPQYQISKH